MAKFAIYYIPPADSKLYQLGSQILGYDIRTQTHLPEVNESRASVKGFQSSWVNASQQYGFHVTTAGTYEFATDKVENIIESCKVIFGLFNPAIPWQLTAHPTDYVQLWFDRVFALRYEANAAFTVLHTVLCTILPQYGDGSRSMSRLERNPELFGDQHHLKLRTEHFFTPYIFDDFAPHLTLINPYDGGKPEEVRQDLHMLFNECREITIESMCLVLLRDDSEAYEIVHEFHREDFA